MTTPSLTIVVLSTDLDNFNEIRTALAKDNRVKLLSGGNDPEQLREEVVRLQPSAVVISLGANAERAIRLVQSLKTECPKTAVISAARETSADLILQSLRAGAQEFLRLPISTDELTPVLDRVSDFCAGQTQAAKKTGRMVAIFSCKGGCGTSFLATNLAASIPARTILVDLNFEAGDLPQLLGLRPKYSIADMVSRRTNLDDRLISVFVAPYSKNLDLLAAPMEMDPIEKIEPEHLFNVLQKLRECYDFVVLDPPHVFDPITLAALDQSDDIVLVLTLDLPAIRSAQRALQIFERVGYARTKVRLLVNRWSKQIDFSLDQVERTLGGPIAASLPSDYQTVVDSINAGTPLVKSNPKSKISREIKRVAQALSAGTSPSPEAKSKRPWSFFLKREPAEKE